MAERHYKVGNIPFKIELEEPWKFMEYTPEVAARIAAAASGENIPTSPVRAGDNVPARTYVTKKTELPEDWDKHTLDFSQYDVFRIPDGKEEDRFSIHIAGDVPDWIKNIDSDTSANLLFKEHRIDGRTDKVYQKDGFNIYVFNNEDSKGRVALAIDLVNKSASIFPLTTMKSYEFLFCIGSMSMLVYSRFAAAYSAAVIHSSVILHNGEANLFLGTSGTGKSTHARLWKEHIPDCELINDDNPVIRFEDGNVYIYGSPWSGKTPCYRNVKAPVRAVVKLAQAAENRIYRLRTIIGFSNILSSTTITRWDKNMMDNITGAISDMSIVLPFWKLECRPDVEAAKLCYNTIENNGGE